MIRSFPPFYLDSEYNFSTGGTVRVLRRSFIKFQLFHRLVSRKSGPTDRRVWVKNINTGWCLRWCLTCFLHVDRTIQNENSVHSSWLLSLYTVSAHPVESAYRSWWSNSRIYTFWSNKHILTYFYKYMHFGYIYSQDQLPGHPWSIFDMVVIDAMPTVAESNRHSVDTSLWRIRQNMIFVGIESVQPIAEN
jgi:hypothetical protein